MRKNTGEKKVAVLETNGEKSHPFQLRVLQQRDIKHYDVSVTTGKTKRARAYKRQYVAKKHPSLLSGELFVLRCQMSE